MAISAGTQLGRYEIRSKIGEGGMGEVYRARDPRLGRDVAIKVLPAAFSADKERLSRFEQEAQAAGALNHPNILSVYDVDTHDGSPYVVSELLEGETLRERLGPDASSVPLPQRKAIDYALQIAHGLAAAHEKGIVHRDLKPENLFITKDGRVKILDFGLAKLIRPRSGEVDTEAATMHGHTDPGVVLGTVGYMSPEQVRGQRVDHRSDIFSFGTVFYEMLSGRRAFHGQSAVETLSAILKEEPAELTKDNAAISPALEGLVRHCLEKNSDERFQSARDLAFAINSLSGLSSGASVTKAAGVTLPSRRWRLQSIVFPVVILVALAGGLFLGKPVWKTSPPALHQITFRSGTIFAARFAPDGQTIIYGAAWEGKPSEVFSSRTDSPELRPLGVADASLLSVSPNGEMALLLHPEVALTRITDGTLARASLAGGAPREILDHVQAADWAANGKDLAVAHVIDGESRLEYPIGTVLYKEPSPGSISHVRVSPKGDMIAFIDHPPVGGYDPRGFVAVVDLSGKKTTLTSEWICALGLAWSPNGDEVWFTASEIGYLQSLRAVTLSGQQRLITQMTGMLLLHDISRDGRVLLARETPRTQAICLPPGETKEHDLSWFDLPFIHDISPDGKTILFDEEGEGGGANGTVYVRKTDGSPAVRLGDGFAVALSPDGNRALTRLRNTTPPQFVLLPTGVGQPKPLPPGTIISQEAGSWFPDGKRILFIGNEPNHNLRAYVQNIDTGEIHPLTPEGLAGTILSPDGKSIIASKRGEKGVIVSTDTGETRPIPGLTDEDNLARWSADGRSLYLFQGKMPMKLYRLDLATGRRELLKEIVPSDPSGVVLINEFPLVTPDGKSYAYTLERELCDLYLVEGLK